MQALSVERTPTSVETLSFSPEEAELAVRAVSHYVVSSLRTLEANWSQEAWSALRVTKDRALEEIDTYGNFIKFGKDLAVKLSVPVEDSEATVDLDPEEIEMLGSSLFRLGNSAVRRALPALQDTGLKSHSEEMEGAVQSIEDTRQRAYELFLDLQPVATSKQTVRWMQWEEPAPSLARAT